MAQHDQNVANTDGATFRADINAALAALFGNSSGTTAPSTTVAYQFWADTTTGLLKIRNAANSNWVTIGTLASTNLGLLALSGGTMTGNLLFTDATYDIGASGATRPRDLFLSRNAVVGGSLTVTGGQVAFPASQAASSDANTLDDYEEGTWTPAYDYVTAGDLSVVYSTQLGRYTKIGDLVSIVCEVVTSTHTHTTASGNQRITGLPFASKTVSGLTWMASCAIQGVVLANYTQFHMALESNSTVVTGVATAQGQALTTIGTTTCASATQQHRYFTLTYHAAT